MAAGVSFSAGAAVAVVPVLLLSPDGLLLLTVAVADPAVAVAGFGVAVGLHQGKRCKRIQSFN